MPLEFIERNVDTDVAATQWQARVDLAAAHRLAVMHGFHEGIFNHLTAARARPQRSLLSDPVRAALVGGDRELLHGGRLRRNAAGRRG